MGEFDDRLVDIARLRALAATHDDDLYRAQVAAQALNNDLRRAVARGDRDREVGLRRRLRELDASIERNRSELTGVRDRIAGRIGDLYLEDPHPRRSLAWLDDGIPFLLAPLR